MKAVLFPGQGSQKIGMGADLFERFRDHVDTADRILGFSTAELCLRDPDRRLNQTQYTQPALFLVNALSYLKYENENGSPDFLVGHSLGEYNALCAASVFDFETGLRLVKKRGELMGRAEGGGMAAVVGLSVEKIRAILEREGHADIDIANLNAPEETVISGPLDSIGKAAKIFTAAGAKLYAPLQVSAAFHSRYMEPARREFEKFLADFVLKAPRIVVISNAEATEYPAARAHVLLAKQLSGPVRFVESIQRLIRRGVQDFHEVGPGTVLTRLVQRIMKARSPDTRARGGPSKRAVGSGVEPRPYEPEKVDEGAIPGAGPTHSVPAVSLTSRVDRRSAPTQSSGSTPRLVDAESLGAASFRSAHAVRHAYVVGSLDTGVTSPSLVRTMAEKGFLACFGAAGLPMDRVLAGVDEIHRHVPSRAFGVGLVHDAARPEREETLVDALMGAGVTTIEVRGFAGITSALVHYRAKGLSRGMRRRILARTSRPEVMEAFLATAPERILAKLVHRGAISPQDAEIARTMPMCDDLCVDIEAGWLADYGASEVLLPLAISLRDTAAVTHGYEQKTRIGMGGIGTPAAAASAVMLGAEFILSGAVNAATVEAGTSDLVKDLLERMGVQDTDFAPCPDTFELGGKIRVLKRGVMFAARANKLHQLYRHNESIDSFDDRTRRQLEERIFHRGMDEVWREVELQLQPEERDRVENSPRRKMAAIFRSYLFDGRRRAIEGDSKYVMDYLIPAAPSLGAFNEWVRGTELERWRNRGIAEVADVILDGAAAFIARRVQEMFPSNEIGLSAASIRAGDRTERAAIGVLTGAA